MTDTRTYTQAELRQIVQNRLESNGGNYAHTAKEIGVKPATVWKLVNKQQKDSPLIRKRLELPKPKRPRLVADVSKEQKAAILSEIRRLGYTGFTDYCRGWAERLADTP